MEKLNQKQINRENLLNQGVGLLMQQGYHGTGLKEILDAVQIPKGSFYNYFGSKENFAAEIIEHYIVPYLEQLQSYWRNPKAMPSVHWSVIYKKALSSWSEQNLKAVVCWVI